MLGYEAYPNRVQATYPNFLRNPVRVGVRKSAKRKDKKKSMKKKVTKTVESSYTDFDTGEIKSTLKTDTLLIDREPDYIKLYIQDVGKLNDIAGEQNNILLEFIRHMGYNNVIPAYKPIKQMIANKLDVSLHTVDKAVKTFKKKGLFISIARGMYMADPELFGKGKWSDIKNLRLVIEYAQDGSKKLKSSLPEQIQLKLGI